MCLRACKQEKVLVRVCLGGLISVQLRKICPLDTVGLVAKKHGQPISPVLTSLFISYDGMVVPNLYCGEMGADFVQGNASFQNRFLQEEHTGVLLFRLIASSGGLSIHAAKYNVNVV